MGRVVLTGVVFMTIVNSVSAQVFVRQGRGGGFATYSRFSSYGLSSTAAAHSVGGLSIGPGLVAPLPVSRLGTTSFRPGPGATGPANVTWYGVGEGYSYAPQTGLPWRTPYGPRPNEYRPQSTQRERHFEGMMARTERASFPPRSYASRPLRRATAPAERQPDAPPALEAAAAKQVEAPATGSGSRTTKPNVAPVRQPTATPSATAIGARHATETGSRPRATRPPSPTPSRR